MKTANKANLAVLMKCVRHIVEHPSALLILGGLSTFRPDPKDIRCRIILSVDEVYPSLSDDGVLFALIV